MKPLNMITDIKEFGIQQANPAIVEKYKDTSPRLIFQYAKEKMTGEGKERFRKSKRS